MIETIIFDVGDVLLEYRWKEMLTDHGLDEAAAMRVGRSLFDDPLWTQGLDMGLKTQAEVIREYRARYPEDADHLEWFITHGERMHVQRPEIWERVHRLKKQGYGIYLLSNYSEDLFHKHTAGAAFMNDIDGMVVSWQIHRVKPDPAIYRYLLDKYRLKPENCLFFDDRAENVQGARKMGIDAIQVTSRKQLAGELDRLLELRS